MAVRRYSTRNIPIHLDRGFAGELRVVGYTPTVSEPEPGWFYGDGTAKSRTTYERLFAKLGTAYGVGDGSTTFNLPDYRGRGFMFALGAAGGSNRALSLGVLGAAGGTETETLSLAQIPAHNHGGATGAESAHVHTGTTSAGSAHSHGSTGLTFAGSGVTTGSGSAHSHGATGLSFSGNAVASGTDSADHHHDGTTLGASDDHAHYVSLTSSGVSADHAHAVSDPGHVHSVANYYRSDGGSGQGRPYVSAQGDNESGEDPSASIFIHSAGTGISLGGMSADHSHTVNGYSGGASATHNHFFSSAGVSNYHTHTVTATGSIGGSTASEGSHTHSVTAAGTVGGATASEASHTHTFTSSAGSSHTHTVASAGSGGSHNNVGPHQVAGGVLIRY